MLLVALLVVLSSTDAFTSNFATRPHSRLFAMDDIDREVAKAKELLREAKAQLAAMDAGEEVPLPKEAANVPFFASYDGTSEGRREIVIKSKNDEGLVTVNGEEMAKLSEEESWSVRPLSEVFENELSAGEDVYKQLGSRDVAASIYNLRKSMKNEDYTRIFDKKNWFIGEDV